LASVCHPDRDGIARAVAALHAGGVVVFPTETVYGVGADLLNEAAVARVFQLKQRDPGLPLMAHCADESQVRGLVCSVGPDAERLMERFWPGPLALVFRASRAVPTAVTGGSATLGIRMVAHRAARALIESFGRAIAGTSANVHGEPAPSRFDSVSRQLLEGVDAAIDAGGCGAGVASTVVDVSGGQPRLVRVGAVAVADIEAVTGRSLAV
jgi:L-threonylcarbamoyladenylate synthase